MYKPKPAFDCKMPLPDVELKVLVLNGSLKHRRELSNTEVLSKIVIDNMKKHCRIKSDIIRLSDRNIPVGLKYKEGKGDYWPKIVDKMINSDIILFATPIWWGQRSSLLQRILERMDAFDEGIVPQGRNALLNKVAGIVITGSEDGAQQITGSVMEVLTFMNFTLPPQCAIYWVGEIGKNHEKDIIKINRSKAVNMMAKNMSRNLVYYAQLLKKDPLVEIKKKR